MRIVSVLIFTLSAFVARAAPAPYELSTTLLSAAPKQLGERFSVQLQLSLDPPYALDMTALPEPARLGLELQQEAVIVQTHWQLRGRRYSITVPLQVISQSPTEQEALVPALVFSLVDGADDYPLVIEPFSVRVLAGFPLEDRAQGEALPLLDSQAGSPARPWFAQLLAMAAGSVLVVLAAGQLFLRVVSPWWERRQRPFARANRHLASRSSSLNSAQRLAIAHRAINETSERTVLSGDLTNFLVENPEYSDLLQSFDDFYRQSNQLCFRRDQTSGDTQSAAELVARCARIEAMR